MLPLLADENFNNDIVRGTWRKEPGLDIVRVQDVGLSGADDATVLAWAADNGRVLLTHDVSTRILNLRVHTFEAVYMLARFGRVNRSFFLDRPVDPFQLQLNYPSEGRCLLCIL